MSSVVNKLRRLLDISSYLIDDRVGIVREVVETPREAGAPDFFHFYGLASNTAAISRQDNFIHTGGASIVREKAFAKAVGEAVERYCSAIFDHREFPLEPAESASFRCVNPAEFSLYSEEQYARRDFPWVPFTITTRIRWVPAVELPSCDLCYVPASMIYVPYFFSEADSGAPIAQPISTGLACHCSFDEAVVGGITEVVERDAFTIFWQCRISPPQVMIETLSDSNFDLVERFTRTGADVTVLEITTDLGIPTFLSVLRNPSPQSSALVFAAASSLDPEEALCKSLEELAHTRRYSQLIKTYAPPIAVTPPHFSNIRDQVGHLGFWADHANKELADFVFASKERIDFQDIQDRSSGSARSDKEQLCTILNQAGYRVFVSDLTTPDVQQLGLSVVHVLVPGLHPLQMGYFNRALGGKRIWTVPQKLGFEGISPQSGDNPLPHPYP
jgi:ribosomal protein S12 methylthiotransferase accessory factor